MLKLLKYNWKRNSTIFLATFAILILAQAGLLLGRTIKDWDGSIILIFSIMIYMAAAMLLFFQVCSTFNFQLKSFNRRLLPVKPIEEIGAVLLLQLIYTAALLLISAAGTTILISTMDNLDFSNVKELLLKPAPMLSVFSYALWSMLSFLIWIMLAIAIARSVKVKHSAWTGIIAFIAIQLVIGWIAILLYGETGDASIGFIHFSGNTNQGEFETYLPSSWFNPLKGTFLLEVLSVSGAIYAITYLMKKKIDL